jgi:hypothetical protein
VKYKEKYSLGNLSDKNLKPPIRAINRLKVVKVSKLKINEIRSPPTRIIKSIIERPIN